MKDKKYYFLFLLILLLFGYAQRKLYSPLTPKAVSIAHFKINPKLIPQSKTKSNLLLTEAEIRQKHGRIELIQLIDGSNIRGVVVKQGDTYIQVETTTGIRQILTDKIDTVEIILHE